MSGVVIVTDSTADLDPAMARDLGIEVVPLFVNFGERRFRDGVDLSRADFYTMLASEPELPTTSQPTSTMFEEVFAPHVAAGRAIVGVFISSKLSGTINAARGAAEQFPQARIELFDSLTATAGLALLAIGAAELARAGADIDAIVESLESERNRQHGYAALPDLSHVVRTGRIGKVMAAVGTLLKIVPVLRLDRGEAEEEARVRTFARAQETLIDATLRGLGDVAKSRIVVIHASALETAQVLVGRLRARLPGEPKLLRIAEAGPVIAVHAGIGATGIFSIGG